MLSPVSHCDVRMQCSCAMFNLLFPSSTVPNEIFERDKSPQFSTRHTAKGVFSQIDGDSVASFGYLPQELVGRSTLDFYHPDDLKNLKDVYYKVMQQTQEKGIHNSLTYRFLIKNGCYITMETDFSSYFDPWSRELEFIIGYHRVRMGPNNVDVFAAAQLIPETAGDETLSTTSKLLQNQILQILTMPVPKPMDLVKQQVSQRCKALATYMETLLEKASPVELKLNVPQEPLLNFLGQSGSVIGEISPHHDYMDSKSSSETQPSYTQLNYNENLERFFNSQPVTEQFDQMDYQLCNKTGDQFSSDSGGNLSSGSNPQSSDSFHAQNLTEYILVRHNEDMEKSLVKNHRVARTHERNELPCPKYEECKVRTKLNGVKRRYSSPQTSGKDPQQHMHSTQTSVPQKLSRNEGPQKHGEMPKSLHLGSMNHQEPSSSCLTSSSSGFNPALLMLPGPQNMNSPQDLSGGQPPVVRDTNSSSSNVVTSTTTATQNPNQLSPMMPNVIYSPSPHPYPQRSVMYSVHIPTSQENDPTNSIKSSNYDGNRPVSQATSVHGHPRSNVGSLASVSHAYHDRPSTSHRNFINPPINSYSEDAEVAGYAHSYPDEHLIKVSVMRWRWSFPCEDPPITIYFSLPINFSSLRSVIRRTRAVPVLVWARLLPDRDQHNRIIAQPLGVSSVGQRIRIYRNPYDDRILIGCKMST